MEYLKTFENFNKSYEYRKRKINNPAILKSKNKEFWIGAVNALDGKIEEVHTYETALNHDFHHSLYFSIPIVDKEDDDEVFIFWINEDGTIDGDFWRNESIVPLIKGKIEEQIKIKECCQEKIEKTFENYYNDYEIWKEDIVDEVSKLRDISKNEAQEFVEMREKFLKKMWSERMYPSKMAEYLSNISIGKNKIPLKELVERKSNFVYKNIDGETVKDYAILTIYFEYEDENNRKVYQIHRYIGYDFHPEKHHYAQIHTVKRVGGKNTRFYKNEKSFNDRLKRIERQIRNHEGEVVIWQNSKLVERIYKPPK